MKTREQSRCDEPSTLRPVLQSELLEERNIPHSMGRLEAGIPSNYSGRS